MFASKAGVNFVNFRVAVGASISAFPAFRPQQIPDPLGQPAADRPGRRIGAVDGGKAIGDAGELRDIERDKPPGGKVIADHRARHVARSEEHTSELQSLMSISYTVICLKKNNNITQ